MKEGIRGTECDNVVGVDHSCSTQSCPAKDALQLLRMVCLQEPHGIAASYISSPLGQVRGTPRRFFHKVRAAKLVKLLCEGVESQLNRERISAFLI
jgi:hypothetical protein